jgi:hypothetical protein
MDILDLIRSAQGGGAVQQLCARRLEGVLRAVSA